MLNILQSRKGLREKTKKKGAGARNICKVWEGRGLYPVSPPMHRDSTEEDHRILRRDVYVLLLNS